MMDNLPALHARAIAKLRNYRGWGNAALLMAANGLVALLAIIRTPAIAWLIPKEQVGMLGVVAAWMAFIQLLSMPGMNVATYHYVATNQVWAFPLNLVYRLRWSMLALLAFFAAAFYWWSRGESSLTWLFIISGVTFPLVNGLSVASNILSARENFTALFWYRMGDAITNFAGFIPLLLSIWWISQVVTFYLVNQVVMALLLLGFIWWIYGQLRASLPKKPSPQAVDRLVGYGRHQTAITSISVVQGRADAFLIGTFFPLTAMADFSIASIAGNQFKQLWSVYASIRYPPLARMDYTQRRRRFLWEGGLVFVGFCGLGVAAYFAALFLVPLLLPPAYITSLPYIGWVIATTVIGMPGGIAETFFRTEEDERSQYVLRIVGATGSVLLPVLLLWFTDLGIIGILLGKFAANTLFSVLGLYLFLSQPSSSM